MDAILFVVFTGLDIEKYECSIYFFNIMFHFALDNPQSLPTSRLTGHLFLFLFIFCGKRSVKQNSIHCYVLEEDLNLKVICMTPNHKTKKTPSKATLAQSQLKVMQTNALKVVTWITHANANANTNANTNRWINKDSPVLAEVCQRWHQFTTDDLLADFRVRRHQRPDCAASWRYSLVRVSHLPGVSEEAGELRQHLLCCREDTGN